MVKTAISAAKPTFPYSDFDVQVSWIPLARIEDPATQAGHCWVIGQCVEEGDRKTRVDPAGQMKPLVIRQLMVQVAYQQSNVVPDDVETIATLCDVMEQLRDAVKNYNYSLPENSGNPDFQPVWIRNEPLRDENGVPMSYYKQREANVFESYFTAYFSVPHQ
jgi:hypothetical protein